LSSSSLPPSLGSQLSDDADNADDDSLAILSVAAAAHSVDDGNGNKSKVKKKGI